MNWQDIAGKIGAFAPLVGAALAGPAGGAVGSIIASALGTDNTPDAVDRAIASDPQAAATIRKAEMDHQKDMQSLVLQGRKTELEQASANIEQVNSTMRAEIAGGGVTWREAVGWGMACNFLLITLALCYAVVVDPKQLPDAISGVMTLVVAQGAVMGVQIHKDNQTKQTAITGLPQSGFLAALKRG